MREPSTSFLGMFLETVPCLTLHICVSRNKNKEKMTCPLIPIWLTQWNTLSCQSIDPTPIVSCLSSMTSKLNDSWTIDRKVVAIDLFYSLFPGPHLVPRYSQYILQHGNRYFHYFTVHLITMCLCVLCLQWVLPEIIATSFIPVVLLISWHWFLFLLSAPLAGYLIHRLGAILPSSHTLVRPQVVEGWLKDWLESQSLNVPSSPFPLPLTSLSHVFPPFSLPITRYVMLTPGSLGVYDPTEIRNRGMLTNFTREAFIKIGYHLVMFFISLYW